MSKMTPLTDWIIREIESKYKEDVCLLLGHKVSEFGEDGDEISFAFFIPATSRSNALARTFIIDGIGYGTGYDLFPVSWERAESIADIRRENPGMIKNSMILYTRNDDDRQRFLSLQARLQANLQNPHYMYNRALEKLNAAMEIMQETFFEEDLCAARANAGGICSNLADAVAYFNQRYFTGMLGGQIEELRSMEKIPTGFIELYERIIHTKMADEQKRLCYEIIAATRAFLAANDKSAVRRISEPNFAELAFWYQELCYTWRRIYHWCDTNNPVNAYMWGCMLQNETDAVAAEFGIKDVDMLSAFDADNLPVFRKRAEDVERRVIEAIESHGVEIESYASVEDFIEKNS